MDERDATSFPVPLDRPLAFLDLETTGLQIGRDRIVELAVVRISPEGEVTEKVRRFDPGIPIPLAATAVHGITNDDVADEPPFAARARSLAHLLEPCDLAGFNIRGFDLPMLLSEFQRAGVPFQLGESRIIDVQAIFHREEPRDLAAAARFYLGRDHEEAHTALSDTRMTAAVLAAQFDRYPHLPRDLQGLSDYCDEVRPFRTEFERWFQEDQDGAYVFQRGKHRGRRLGDVANEEPDYLRWMLSVDDLDDRVLEAVRKIVRELESLRPAPS